MLHLANLAPSQNPISPKVPVCRIVNKPTHNMNKSIFTTLALFKSDNYDSDGDGMERVVCRTTNATT